MCVPRMLVLAILAGCYISIGGMVGIAFGKGVPLADLGTKKFLFGFVSMPIFF